MEWLVYLVAVLFSLLGLASLGLVALSLPGTWITLVLALVIELVDGYYMEGEDPTTFGWWLLGVCLVLALIGEALEFAAGAVGTKFGGGTKRGMIGAVIGGIAGAIVLTPLLPIPVVGTLVGALVGTFAGAYFAEKTHPNPPPLPVPAVAGAAAAAEDDVPPAGVDAEGAAPAAADGDDPVPPAGLDPRDPANRSHVKAAVGATVGRLLGTVGKLAVGFVVWITLTVAAFV